MEADVGHAALCKYFQNPNPKPPQEIPSSFDQNITNAKPNQLCLKTENSEDENSTTTAEYTIFNDSGFQSSDSDSSTVAETLNNNDISCWENSFDLNKRKTVCSSNNNNNVCVAEQQNFFTPCAPAPAIFTNSHPNTFYGVVEPGGLKEVDDLTRYAMQMIDSNATGWNTPIFSRNVLGWGDPFNIPPPVPANPSCQSCQVMRRIIHTNGIEDSKLEVHGIHGQPFHCLSACWFHPQGMPPTINVEIVEFPTKDPEEAKQFIAQYMMVRRNEGSVLRHDSFMLATDITTKSGTASLPASTVAYWNNNSNNNTITGLVDGQLPPKTSYSAQRQRTGKIQMSELASFFHLPITEAAKQLRICPTVMKKICRNNGVKRWPHRKIKSIQRSIEQLETALSSDNHVEDTMESRKSQIASLRNELASVYSGFL